jgi:hypothetical protein
MFLGAQLGDRDGNRHLIQKTPELLAFKRI